MTTITTRISEITSSARAKTAWSGIFVFLLSFALVSFRNLEPLSYPVVFAEDGTWIGQILVNGFFHTAFRVKDFPVFGVALLDQFALWLTHVLPGGFISLPLAFFIVANFFFASVATLAAVSLRDQLPTYVRAAMWIAVLFMPVGMDGNEIFGRALNLPFVFPVLQVLLVARLMVRPASGRIAFTAAVVSLICGWTFPVCVGITGIAALLLVQVKPNTCRIVIPYQVWLLGLSMIGSVAAMRIVAFTGKGGADLPYLPSGLIEFSLARVTLFPFVSFFYARLSDPAVMLIAIVGAVLFGMMVPAIARTRPDLKRVAMFVIGSFALYVLATVVMRRGFTSILSGRYETTFPDRYFLGLNILAVFAASVAIYASGLSLKFKQAILGLWMLATLATPIFDGRIFEFSHPAMKWHQHGTFKEGICGMIEAKSFDKSEQIVEMPIYPWEGTALVTMALPTQLLTQIERSGQCRASTGVKH